MWLLKKKTPVVFGSFLDKHLVLFTLCLFCGFWNWHSVCYVRARRYKKYMENTCLRFVRSINTRFARIYLTHFTSSSVLE